MAANHWVFTELASRFSQYLKMVDDGGMWESDIYKRIEPRTRKADFATALSFEVFDPLWMLTRQWQFGRFKGNDCGSIVTAKVKVSRRRLDSLYLNRNMEEKKAYSTDTPLEYDVEKQNRAITPFVLIESALHFKKLAEGKLFTRGQAIDSASRDAFMKKLMEEFPLDPFIPFVEEADKTIETLKKEQNANLKRFYAAYGRRIFDGYKLYVSSLPEITGLFRFDAKLQALLTELIKEYKTWFSRKYLPLGNKGDNCWNEQKLAYEAAMGENGNVYEAEDYHTGKLSWYSFDGAGEFSQSGKKEEKMLSYLPAIADFPGAPNRRLWEFEDVLVQFGHHANSDFSLLANAVVMQYVSMYGNDWLITPLEAEAGTILDVEGVIITDTFGDRIFIGLTAEEADNRPANIAFTDRWNLFGTTKAKAYENNDFRSQGGLLFPPTLPRCEESNPVEEVQFLRDEMANMLWGVETVIDDGCDGVWEGKTFSDAVLSVVDAQKGDAPEQGDDYEYSFLVQNRVPINWIPFVPQKIPGEMRDIRFRRGKMPVFFNGKYNSVRPSTELLKVRKDEDGRVIPRYINEEEITGYDVKLVLTAQRTRWFYGKSFTWSGFKKVISMYQANSGLMFDELIEKESNKTITLREEKEIQYEES